MRMDIILALQSHLKKDYSEENQYKQAEMIDLILEINQAVICSGIGKLEDYEHKTRMFPMLFRGLKLVRSGVEPQIIESILLNIALANNIDLLESLLVIEGVSSIQILRSPDLTKELVLSYFSFPVQDQVRERLQHVKLNSSEPLTRKEVEKLLHMQALKNCAECLSRS